MYNKKKKQQQKYLLFSIIGIILLIGLIINYTIPNRNLDGFTKIIKDLTLFIEKSISSPFNQNGKETAHEEELYLKSLNTEYQKEIEDMKKLLGLNSALSDTKHINATIINRNVDYWSNTLTIDKGSNDGISENMAVINQNGLIGNITKVSHFSSTVSLLTNTNRTNKLSVKIMIGDDYVYGLLTNYDVKSKKYVIEGITENTFIPVDSLVTTTGMGKGIPSGILIGKVDSVVTDNFDLSKIALVKSDINFNSLSYVTILIKGDEKW